MGKNTEALKNLLNKKSGRVLVFVSVSFLALLIFVLIVNAAIKDRVGDRIYDVGEDIGEKRYDIIIVLGAGLKKDGTPSDMLKDRVETAVKLYMSGASDKILMSGDVSEGHDEVGAMKRTAMALGVPEEAILIDEKGCSTYESMENAARAGCRRMLAVTQKYHLYRTVYIAERLGLDVEGYAADTRRYKHEEYRNIREAAARIKDAVKCMKLPE